MDELVELYHGTTKEAAEAIRKSGVINGPVYMGPKAVAEQYGEELIKVKVPKSKLMIDFDLPGGRLLPVESANGYSDLGSDTTIDDYLRRGNSVGVQDNVRISSPQRGTAAAVDGRSGMETRINAAIDKAASSRGATGAKAPSDAVRAASQRLNSALGSPSFSSELAAVTKGMKAGDVKALEREFTSGTASSKAAALKKIDGRNSALMTSLSKSRATGGRIAGAVALAVGVGAALSTLGSSGAEAAQKKKQKSQGPSKNAVAAKQAEAASKAADAQAKAAEAQAEQAKTETRRLELEAESRRADRMEKRREEDASIGNQVRQVALVGAPLAAGIAYGAHKANKIDKAASAAQGVANRNLGEVADKVRQADRSPGRRTPGISKRDKLSAAVRVTDKLKLNKVKGPLGGATAAFLLTEAVAARVIAANTENETAKEVLNAAGLGLGAAAVGTVGTRMIQRATSTTVPSAGDLVDVEAAKEFLARKAPDQKPKARRSKPRAAKPAVKPTAKLPALPPVDAAAPPAAPAAKAPKVPAAPNGPSIAEMRKIARDAGIKGSSQMSKTALSAVLRGAGKLVLPVVAGAAAVTTFAGASQAGESTGEATKQAALAAGDVLSMGAVTTFGNLKAAGASDAEAGVLAAVKGAISYATMGTAEIANELLASEGGVANAISSTVVDAAKAAQGKIQGWSDAAREAAAKARGAALPGEGEVAAPAAKKTPGNVANADAASDDVSTGLKVAAGGTALAAGGHHMMKRGGVVPGAVMAAAGTFAAAVGAHVAIAQPSAEHESAPRERGGAKLSKADAASADLTPNQLMGATVGAGVAGLGVALSTETYAPPSRKKIGRRMTAAGLAVSAASFVAGEMGKSAKTPSAGGTKLSSAEKAKFAKANADFQASRAKAPAAKEGPATGEKSDGWTEDHYARVNGKMVHRSGYRTVIPSR